MNNAGIFAGIFFVKYKVQGHTLILREKISPAR